MTTNMTETKRIATWFWAKPWISCNIGTEKGTGFCVLNNQMLSHFILHLRIGTHTRRCLVH